MLKKIKCVKRIVPNFRAFDHKLQPRIKKTEYYAS